MLHLSTLKYDFNLLGFFLNTGSAFIFYVLALLATHLGGRHQMSASRRTGEVEVDVLTSAAGALGSVSVAAVRLRLRSSRLN